MARGPPLSEEEKILINRHLGAGKLQVDIARLLNRSTRVIANYLRDPVGYGKRKSPGRPRILSRADKIAINSHMSRPHASIRKATVDSSVLASRSTVWRHVVRDGRYAYKKKMKTLDLQPRHIAARLRWAVDHTHWKGLWNIVLFSDEKRLNLDGPDGCKHYWQDLRKERRTYFSRHSGGGGIMVWAAVSAKGKTDLFIVDGTLNKEKYTGILETVMLPFAHDKYGTRKKDFRFMQDNASVHTARHCKAWFKQHKVNVLPWPALSPDLNPIENVWGVLAKAVYANGRQFKSVQELKTVVLQKWEDISDDLVRHFINSMPQRCLKVIKADGKKIKY